MKNIVTELPNGQTLRVQVPDDWSDSRISQEIDTIAGQAMQGQGQQPPRQQVDLDAWRRKRTEGLSTWLKASAGMGQGFRNVGLQVGNLMGLVSPEEMAPHMAEQYLMETTPGQVGKFAGELLATAPIAGGAVGAAGKLAGAAVPALRTMAAARPITTGAATGAAEGAIEGAIMGGPGNRLEGAQAGAVGGAAVGGALPAIARGLIRPTADATRLMDKGVDLSAGQMRPSSFLNRIEQAVESFGASSGQGEQLQFAQKLAQDARAPGSVRLREGKLADMLTQMQGGYNKAYEPIKAVPVNQVIPQQLKTAFEQVVEDADILATDDQRKLIGKFLDNQLTKLKGRKLTAGDVMSVRSKIRGKVTDLKRGQKWEEAQLMEGAESELNEILNRAIPDQAAQFNRNVDYQYAKYKTVEDALSRMGDRDFPTPSQWSASVKLGTPKGAYARGAGRMRPDIEAGRNVFQTVSPRTGNRLATLGAASAGLGGAYGATDLLTMGGLTAASLPLLGTKTGRQALAGRTDPQAVIEELLRNNPLLGQYLRGAGALGAQ